MAVNEDLTETAYYSSSNQCYLLVEQNKKLWRVNDRLSKKNTALGKELLDLTRSYDKLLKENNENIASLENKIDQLRIDIQNLKEARISQFKIPEAWIKEDFYPLDEEE